VRPLSLDAEERRTIATLKRLAKRWPPSLWLFSASGNLNVMRCNADGERVYGRNSSVDPDFIVEKIDIPNDGGDW
jgi:hypothetical protein